MYARLKLRKRLVIGAGGNVLLRKMISANAARFGCRVMGRQALNFRRSVDQIFRLAVVAKAAEPGELELSQSRCYCALAESEV